MDGSKGSRGRIESGWINEEDGIKGGALGGLLGIGIDVASFLLGATDVDGLWEDGPFRKLEYVPGRLRLALGLGRGPGKFVEKPFQRTSIFVDFHRDEFGGRSVAGSINWDATSISMLIKKRGCVRFLTLWVADFSESILLAGGMGMVCDCVNGPAIIFT
jgi:hypothetical protein